MKNLVYVTSDTNIYRNLSRETWLAENTDGANVLYLWQNAPCVVIGKFQNPWSECNLEQMKKDGVLLSRRFSGGGAVYHDLGNVCFTFISDKKDYSEKRNFKIVLDALQSLGVKASLSGRNDILYNGRKISGNAFRHTAAKSSHHGTMLLSSNTGIFAKYLTPNNEKLKSHAVKSVESRVVNLDIDCKDFMNAMIKSFEKEFGPESVEYLKEEDVGFVKLEQLSSDAWNLGATPVFDVRQEVHSEAGHFEIFMNIKNGAIEQCRVYSDTLDLNITTRIEDTLKGMLYDERTVEKAVAECER